MDKIKVFLSTPVGAIVLVSVGVVAGIFIGKRKKPTGNARRY